MIRPLAFVPLVGLAAAASLGAQTQTRTVRGEITDTAGLPLDQVDVLVTSDIQSTRTRPDGRFELEHVRLGEQRFLFRRVGYHRIEVTLLIDRADREIVVRMTPVAVELDPVVVAGRRTGLMGVVGDVFYQPVADVEIVVVGGGRTVTDSAGRFSLPQIAPGNYLLRVRKKGYYAVRRSVVLPPGEYQELSLLLLPAPAGLTPARLAALGGFGSRQDWLVEESYSRRLRCAGEGSVLITREELAEQGEAPLDVALPRTTSGIGKGYGQFELRQYTLFIDGQPGMGWPLTGVRAEDVEAVEIYRGRRGFARTPVGRSFGNSRPIWRPDLNAAEGCPEGTIWVWTR